jgi:hypothetical protein
MDVCPNGLIQARSAMETSADPAEHESNDRHSRKASMLAMLMVGFGSLLAGIGAIITAVRS